MMENITTFISAIAAGISTIIAAVALIVSVRTQRKMREDQRKQATVEAFHTIQKAALDELVHDDKEKFYLIIERIDDKEYKRQYNHYKTLIARLEHFSVGVNEGVYDFEVTDKLAGAHLIYLYPQIKPIIDYANRNSKNNDYYKNYVVLVQHLKERHPEIKTEEK